ncbi:DNRLRE domain-containing protein [Nocardioides sp. NPDC006273]|uniref:DNRLRE domain-containing protein n=1 Tax=Nocardioides sp. NPDC006273 TaxID=3155598 RepID=UPI00339DE460
MALVLGVLSPISPAAAKDDVSEADAAAAREAASGPEQDDDDGGWFAGLFGGGDDGDAAEDDDLDPAPKAKGASVKDRKHKSTFGHAPKYDPKAKRVKELTSKRSESARYWRLSDGRTQVELSPKPTSYRSGSGKNATWKPIDTTVGTSADKAFVFANTTNSGRSWFSDRPEKLVKFTAPEGQTATLGLDGAEAKSLKPSAKGSKVVYADAFGKGTDLEYVTGPGRVQEFIVLDKAPAKGTEQLVYTFTLDVSKDLYPVEHPDGSIGIYGELANTPVMVIPAAYMTDEKKDASSPYGTSYSGKVKQRLLREGGDEDGAWKVELEPDMEWLTSPEREGEIRIDPTITITPNASASQDAMVISTAPDTNYNTSWKLSVGVGSGGLKARSLIKFPLTEIPANTPITSATMELYFDQAHETNGNAVDVQVRRALSDWTESTATWNTTKGLVSNYVNDTVTKPVNQFNSWHKFNLKQPVQNMLDGKVGNYGFVLRAADESSTAPLGGPRYEAGDGDYGAETSTLPRLTVTYGKVGTALESPQVVHSTGPELHWPAYVNSTGSTSDDIVEYQLHRSTRQAFNPSAATLVAPINSSATSFTDTTATPTADSSESEIGRSYYYQIVVKTKANELIGSPTRLVGVPKAGRTMRLIQGPSQVTDTTLSSGKPTTNLDTINIYGPQSWLSVGNSSPSYGNARALMKFDTTPIPATAKVLESRMFMWGAETTTGSDGATYQLRRMTAGAWTETGATWNTTDGSTSWSTPGGDFGPNTADIVESVHDVGRHWWDATGMTQRWVTNPVGNRGALVKLADESSNGPQERTLWLSAEAPDWQLGPLLRVIYVDATPEDTYYAPSTPTRVAAGATATVPVTVTNTTAADWAASGKVLTYSWQLPDGTDVTGTTKLKTTMPSALAPGQSQTVSAKVKAPADSDTDNVRTDYTLTWKVEDASTGAVAAPGLKQEVAVEEPTSDQLGLESFYSYVGKNTGAGGTLMGNVASGNAVWSYDAFSNPGRGLSTFGRFAYNSQDTSDTVLGFGWSGQIAGITRLGAPLDFHPNPRPTEIRLPDGDGTTHLFKKDATTGEWIAPKGVNYRLTPKAGLDCTPEKDPIPDAWTLLRPDGTRFIFGCDGYMTSVVDKNGNTQTFTYTERKSNNQPRKFLTYITDPSGRRTLEIDYWEKGQSGYTHVDPATGNLVTESGKLTNSKIYDHVRAITDISGRRVEFYYTDKGLMGRMVDGAGAKNGAGDSIAKSFKFTYDADQGNKNVKLTKVTDPRGNSTSMDYYAPSQGDDPKDHWSLQTITDRLNHTTGFDYVTNATTDTWVDTTVTDSEAHATKYVSDNLGRPRSVTNAKDQKVELTWDGDNNTRTLTEANGAVTAYCYDPKTGYPIWQRDPEQNKAHGGAPAASECAAGQTAATAPAGSSVYEYATRADGYAADIFRTTSPAGRKNQFSYDSYGNLLTVTDGKGLATTTEGDYTTTYTYDSLGQLLTAKDANENVTKYRDYTPVGYPKTTEDAKGNIATTTYDERGLVTKVQDPLDGVVTQAYDAFGRPLAGTTKVSAERTITTPAPVFDANDNVTVSTAPNGAVSTATYDAADQVSESTAPKDTSLSAARVSKFTYDTVGNLLKATEPKGTATTDAGDFVTSYFYDAVYQQSAVENANGDRIEYDYDTVGNVVEVRDPSKTKSADTSDYTSKATYDLNHQPRTVKDAEGNTTSTEYDADGLTLSTTNAEGHTAYTSYDERGSQVETKTPWTGTGDSTVYRTTRYAYDEVGNTTRVTTPRGAQTANEDDFVARTAYDELNRPVRSYQPYDPSDARFNDPNVFTETTYDAAGRAIKTSLPPSDGQTVRNTTSVDYYANGWIKASTDAWGIKTRYEYDDLGAQTARTLTSADGSASRTMTWAYYPDGKLKAKADDGIPVGSHSVVTDDDTNGLFEMTGTWAKASATGQQGTSHRTHAAATGSTDKFTWTLDVPADGTYTLAAAWPQVTGAATDAKFTLNHGDGAGTDVNFTANQTTGAAAWNTLGEVTLKKGEKVTVVLAPSAGGTVVADSVRLVRDNAADTDAEDKAFAYGYDLNGNLTDITDTSRGTAKNADAYAMAYDGLNQIKSVREDLAGSPAATTSYTYNNLGKPLTVAHPDQASDYVYDDPRNLLTKVSVDDLNDTKAAKVTNYTYDVLGRQKTITKGNGNVTTNAFQADGALKSMREETSAGALVASHDYKYDANGNQLEDVASKRNADDASATLDSTTSYVYDPVDRLSKKTKTGHNASTETYVHDANANVIQQTVGGTSTSFNYDRNRLLSSTVDGQTASYRYDPFGRQTSVVGGGKTISRTTYDGFDHIKVAEKANDAGVLEATRYTYDPLDRTASKTTSGTDGKTTDYTYLGLSQEVLGEEVAGELTKSYQYSPWGQRLSQVSHQADTEVGVEAGETGYYGYNAHTDVETVTDDAGETVATYGYTAYGENDEAEFTGIDKPDAESSESPADESFNAYRFNGKRWDAGSGTYDMGFRDYNPGLNTFTTRDMYNGALADMGLGTDPFTSNRYAFAAGNPISGIEFDGHMLLDSPGGGGDAPAPADSNCYPGSAGCGEPNTSEAPQSVDEGWVPDMGAEPEGLVEQLNVFVLNCVTKLFLTCQDHFAEQAVEEWAETPDEAAAIWLSIMLGLPMSGPAAGAAGGSKTLMSFEDLVSAVRSTDRAATNGTLSVTAANASASELRAAGYMASLGRNVELRDPAGARGTATSDLLVDGMQYDVYTPTSSNPNNIIRGIAKKGSQVQGGGVVLDLSQTGVTRADLGDIMARVANSTSRVSDVVVLP